MQCDKKFTYSKTARKKGYRKKLCNSCSTANSRRKRKKRAVDYKGGKCEICGYKKCIQGIHFHHRDPEHKDFGFSAKGLTRSWEKQKRELDKCAILCANCHAEVHAGIASVAHVGV